MYFLLVLAVAFSQILIFKKRMKSVVNLSFHVNGIPNWQSSSKELNSQIPCKFKNKLSENTDVYLNK